MSGLSFGFGLLTSRVPFGGDGPPGEPRYLTEAGDFLLLEEGWPIYVDTTIPGTTPAESLDGSEYVALVQDGVTVRATITELREFFNG